MAFINLELIGALRNEARHAFRLAESVSYGWDKEESTMLDPETYMMMIKAHFQAKNLFDNLSKLHTVLSDFAAGDFQKYIEQFEEFAEDGQVFDPIDDVLYFFTAGTIDGRGTIHSLPPKIEQYAELCALTGSYARIRETSRTGIQKIFGDAFRPHYEAEGPDRERTFVPESELPADLVDVLHADRDIKEIETEYALDKYNDFYHACRVLIEVHACSAEYETEEEAAQGLAVELLGYFKAN
ncbi:hypothetical protein [Larkinella punicea]|uniref:Uncharacterized protein n=1 Tax=Larkinella punicea TaxID=2315727 RepID=A0A368JKW2_9BACT|nr:hypothetical protein [Larkinella punicea]RCR68298.1 hypothetical protein DUE52_18050 [Larkinella punicea]